MPDGQHPGAFGGGWVGPGYFETMRIPIREGRAFTDDDLRNEKVIVINEVMARRYFPGESAIGKRLRLNQKGDWSTIVGVVGAVRSSHADEGGIQIYFPLTEAAMFPDTAVLVATSGDPAALIPAIKGQVWSLDPKLPLREVTTIEQRVAETLARPRFNVVLLSIFASLGLLLAAIGIYGVISYSVGMRTREIGVRMALGALPADIKRGVLGEAMALAGLGAMLGLAGSLLLSRLMRT